MVKCLDSPLGILEKVMGGGTVHQHLQLPASLLRSTPANSSISSPSSSSTQLRLPVSTDDSAGNCCPSGNCMKLELVNCKEEKRATGCRYNHLLHPVPSQIEVEDAVAALQKFMQAISSSGTVQQISGFRDSRMLQNLGYQRLNDVFQLLQSDPSVKRLVVSLSSDKAVWNAVMSNLLHQKLEELPNSVECRRPQISNEPEFSLHVLSWILEIIKGKIMELIENFQSLMNDLFQSRKMEKATVDATELEEKVRSSLLLSIVVLLIVIMARVQS